MLASKIDQSQVYKHCHQFLCQENRYVDAALLKSLKRDSVTMLNLLRLHQIQHLVCKLVDLAEDGSNSDDSDYNYDES